jgi:hypothetical protein
MIRQASTAHQELHTWAAKMKKEVQTTAAFLRQTADT